MRTIERRIFLKEGAVALFALGLPPAFLSRPLLAGTGGSDRRRTLVCLFQRGAVDGLNMVVPFGDAAYYKRRRSIAIPAPRRGSDEAALDLDGRFGLHPALAPLRDLYARSELAVVHAVGSPHPTRSHFDAQDFMESGTPGEKSTRDGWLNRALAATPCACEGRTLASPAAHAADHAGGQVLMADSPLRGIAVGGELPRILRGSQPTLAIPDLSGFGLAGGRDPGLEDVFGRMYRREGGDLIASTTDGAFEAVERLRRADPARYRPASGVEYPPGTFGRALRQIAQLIKADVGMEVAFADVGGWDTHVAQGGTRGQLANRLRPFAQAIRAFHDDLGDRMEDVVVLTMSEFGRTVAENGSGGTDHGHANCVFVLGGSVKGGRVLGEWPGLEPEQLYERRDLAVTTDFRDVFAEVIRRHLGTTRLEDVFPGHSIGAREPIRLFG
ncbi:MAG: DUF1501 domain-containing protein [Gemmatimonadota bacterium]